MKTIAIISALFALSISTATVVGCSGSQTNTPPATTTTSSAQLDGLRINASGVLPNGAALSSELSFKQGMFDSTACHQFGYAPGRYTMTREGDGAILFRADMSGKEGVETWSGRIVGDKVTGSVTGPDGKAIAFTGTAVH